jgi:hypothetical protein
MGDEVEEENVHDPLINLELWDTLASALGFTGEQRINEYVMYLTFLAHSCVTLSLTRVNV